MTDTQGLYKDLIRYSYSDKRVLCSIITADNSSFQMMFEYNSFQEYDNKRYYEINTESDTTFTIDTRSIKSITWDNTENEYEIVTDYYKMYISIL